MGGTALVLHPRYLFGSLKPVYYEEYRERNHARALLSYKAMSEMMIKNALVKVKEHPPYLGDMEGKVLLNSLARASPDAKTGSYSFTGKLNTKVPLDLANAQSISDIITNGNLVGDSILGVGVDQGV